MRGDTRTDGHGGRFRHLWLAALAVPVLVAAILLAVRFADRIDQAAIEAWVASAGAWGPLAVIGLMIVAVVASPLPSAPIAMASGAAYGHYAGTAYVAIGAEIGALIAFLIARGLGRSAVERLLGDKADYGLLGSQNALTLTVFVSRLLPFVSFDAMSYAAGLSQLHAWRFALATLAGILPASFVLAHLGSAAMQGDFGRSGWIAAGLGIATAVPLLFLAVRRTSRRGRDAARRRAEEPGDRSP
ncbi:TVP38/TMEM64 family protein [Roseibacterium sp. SDUM158017]|uniref:TVP38/TMEM64 family protein n=1 Tax=Roseicyclus salinarum TaxID=3036773 RepID=UPI00241584ED|nr:TVP38/TMEM64 family protein [Roseibacterium sp. SDUM158017]MDG4649263.1 TVP38/TMEM64 family protein [Roseibacterium sp. SDUM158017]